MEKLKFKTNIKCGACLANVKPELEKLSSLEGWEVDLSSPNRILSIMPKPNFKEEELHRALQNAGYKAEAQ